jgi:hypothetical protein
MQKTLTPHPKKDFGVLGMILRFLAKETSAPKHTGR